uniref:Uncharacterized protein n=1 Tax=Eutreptiella gymnastica TaxID=73025 RepID=A0A7S4LFR9_9EUGL
MGLSVGEGALSSSMLCMFSLHGSTHTPWHVPPNDPKLLLSLTHDARTFDAIQGNICCGPDDGHPTDHSGCEPCFVEERSEPNPRSQNAPPLVRPQLLSISLQPPFAWPTVAVAQPIAVGSARSAVR